MPDYDILVPGEINPDLILSGDSTPVFGQVEKLVAHATLTIGSSSAIFACGAARLGLRVAFIGKCGEDVFGRFMLDEMRKREVDVSHAIQIPGGETGLSVILNRGSDRAILTFPGLMGALKAEDVPDELLSRARHLHVASYFLQTALQPGLASLFERAHLQGLTTSLDTNWDPEERWTPIRRLMPLIDVFLPNQAEACAITNLQSAAAAAAQLAESGRIVAVKSGVEGAFGAEAGQVTHAPSLPVQVIDTVGAGDSFDAGFLYGFLNGWDLAKALRLGTVCGTLSTRASGGTTAQPALEEAQRHL